MITHHKTPNICHAELVEAPTPNIGHRSPSLTNRVLALFLTFTVLLPSITPYNNLWANNNGPNAPEAASFEPVDATDMVNLMTGDFSYVLPLMNVPSPEGGYPIALAYHGGIAMDLESSWVGLGWNLNPGAINRSVNGYPDDYSNTTLTDYFYDQGGEDVNYFASAGYTNGVVSVGVGFNWGSNQSLSGTVSVGYGPFNVSLGPDGTTFSGGYGPFNFSSGPNGTNIGVGFNFGDHLSIGADFSSDGGVRGNIGLSFDTNGAGFNIGTSTDGTYSMAISQTYSNGFSTGINLSSEGASFTGASQSVGIGAHTVFNSTISQGDYTVNHSGFTIPVVLPTPIGIFSFSFGREKVIYSAEVETNTLITGPLNFHEPITSEAIYKVFCENLPSNPPASDTTFYSYEQAQQMIDDYPEFECGPIRTFRTSVEAFMDVYEVPLSQDDELAENYNITYNNPVFPAYDKFNVQAQGLSGSIHATLVDNGRLFGLSKNIKTGGNISYEFNGSSGDQGTIPRELLFESKPEFYFDNEISSYLAAPKASFRALDLALNTSSIKYVFDELESSELSSSRFTKSNHIEYFSNKELLSNGSYPRRVLNNNNMLNRSNFPNDGIGAYIITAADGKTYHYSLPVYNHETITRTYGLVEGREEECQSYLEKRQLEPYATHWLLTAVTGPDFVDNGDGLAGAGDLGYWVNFDYGLWSDAYVWSPHPDEPFIEDVGNPSIKTWVKGRKQLYYLDKITTRTHTAVFIKSEDESNPSLDWQYKSVDHDETRESCGRDFEVRFTIPNHKRLKLDRILLLKNENFELQKDGGMDSSQTVNVRFNDSDKPNQEASYNQNHKVFDTSDNWQILSSKALKEVVLDQDYKLSNDQLTLNGVDFNGKQAASVLPPYRFSYIEDEEYTFDREDANDWGYFDQKPELWSLDGITTPQGGKIVVNYEPHNFRSVENHGYTINDTKFIFENGKFEFEIDDEFNIYEGGIADLDVSFVNNITMDNHVIIDGQIFFTYSMDAIDYKGKASIEKIETSNNGKTIIQLIANDSSNDQIVRRKTNSLDLPMETFVGLGIDKIANSINNSYSLLSINSEENGNIYKSQGGIRVKNITTTDGIQSFSSEYTYGENEDGYGWVTYVPFAPEAQKEIPYSSELPPSRPMYEYVTHASKDNNGDITGKMEYQFNVLKNKEEDAIKFGNFYELIKDRDDYGAKSSRSVSINEYTINDNLNAIGQLISVSSYNKEDQLLSKLSNTYCTPEELPEDIGVVQESYQSYKKFTENNVENWMVNSSTRIKYPSLLKSSTELKNGVSYTTIFSDFDLISGQAKQTHSVSSLGLEIKTVSEPAFYHYPDMGSKADDINNKNMLSQHAQTLSYFKRESSTDWELYGAEVDTWKAWDNDVWRKHQSYVWKGALNENGSYKDFVDFNWDNTIQADGWQRISEITKYSDYSRALETMDINGDKLSSKLGDDHSKVIAVSNAPYDAMFYTGFENIEGETYATSGGFNVNDIVTLDKAHTGKKALKISLPNTRNTYALILKPGDYSASVWAHKDNYKNTKLSSLAQGLIDYNPNEIVQAGDWVKLNFTFKLENAETIALITTTSEAYYDDFRIHPTNASMTSYVYNEWDELTHIIGANNMATKYEYDAAGRLYKTYTEVAKNASTEGGFKLINQTNYNYKNH